MADIFLSYKREDRDRAQRIERALTAQGWDVFWDHELLPSTVPFRVALAQELERARCVLVLWSHRSVESEWVLDEDAARPLSDSRIAEVLGAEGLPLARRTVAKYREELRLPPSNLRKTVH